jgi:hypothetical protein
MVSSRRPATPRTKHLTRCRSEVAYEFGSFSFPPRGGKYVSTPRHTESEGGFTSTGKKRDLRESPLATLSVRKPVGNWPTSLVDSKTLRQRPGKAIGKRMPVPFVG